MRYLLKLAIVLPGFLAPPLFGQTVCPAEQLATTRCSAPASPASAAAAIRPKPTAVAPSSATYPRIANLFWGGDLYLKSPEEADQVQLYLGPNMTADMAQSIRGAAPNTPILPTINAMGTVNGVPIVPDNSYYLHDVNGNMIQTWPGTPGDFVLNVTLPKVQQFLAQYASQQMSQYGFNYDGIFFDDVETTISNLTDYEGNPVQISSKNNGVADDPGALDAAWSAGMYNEIAAFRKLAPNAYVVGHVNQLPSDPRSLANFNGDAMGFDVVNVREGEMGFGTLWDTYQKWFTQGKQPVMTTLQSSPPNQIAYGYGYTPLAQILPQTAMFGQTFYPNMRFGLTLTLMNDGYFLHDFGDSTTAVAWWYDEFNFNLGAPAAPAQAIGAAPSANEVSNSGFETGLTSWVWGVTNDGSGAATLSLETTDPADGKASAHIAVTSAAKADWHVDLEEGSLALAAGKEYEVQFWARADRPITFNIATQGGAPDYAPYGLNQIISIGTSWGLYSASFISTVTAKDARLQFFLGNEAGNIWIDDVQLYQAPERLYRRDFTGGVVLLNGTNSTQTIHLPAGLERFNGTQAPLYQYIVDDSDAGFTTTGSWKVDTFDSGFRTASGPYYHAWQKTLHELDGSSGSAQWNLGIPTKGQYTIQVWLPAAPSARAWTKNAVYKVVAGSQVLATVNLDQSLASGGDQWFTIANLNLTAGSKPVLQVTNGGSGPLIADAVYVYSTTALYNDGSAAPLVTLAPMDGILLQRLPPTQSVTFPPLSNKDLAMKSFSLAVSASSGLEVDFISNTPSICIVSGSNVTLTATGTCSITATQPGNDSQAGTIPVTQTFDVFQSISFPAPSGKKMGEAPFVVAANSSSGLPVQFASTTPAYCSVSGGMVALIAAGTCTLQATQPGNAIIAAATPVTQSFAIAPSGPKTTPLLTWKTPAPIYCCNPLTAAQLDARSNVAGTFSYNWPLGSVLPPGSWKLTASFAPANTANYNTGTASIMLTIDKGLPVIIWAAPAPITYGTALTYRQLGAESGVKGTFSYSPASGTVLPAGTHTLSTTLTPIATKDYNVATKTQRLTVNKAVLTVTADNLSIEAGSKLPALSYTNIGLVDGDTAAKATSGAPTLATSAKSGSPAGTYTITPSAGTLAAANYSFKFANGTLTITPAGTAAMPAFLLASGTYNSPQSVTLADTNAGATIYYTTNGATPTTASTKYTGAIAVSSTETIKAIAVAAGKKTSPTASVTYTIK
jgi:hypothetical protein